jgi:hypothetical protein
VIELHGQRRVCRKRRRHVRQTPQGRMDLALCDLEDCVPREFCRLRRTRAICRLFCLVGAAATVPLAGSLANRNALAVAMRLTGSQANRLTDVALRFDVQPAISDLRPCRDPCERQIMKGLKEAGTEQSSSNVRRAQSRGM